MFLPKELKHAKAYEGSMHTTEKLDFFSIVFETSSSGQLLNSG